MFQQLFAVVIRDFFEKFGDIRRGQRGQRRIDQDFVAMLQRLADRGNILIGNAVSGFVLDIVVIEFLLDQAFGELIFFVVRRG